MINDSLCRVIEIIGSLGFVCNAMHFGEIYRIATGLMLNFTSLDLNVCHIVGVIVDLLGISLFTMDLIIIWRLYKLITQLKFLIDS